MKKKFTFSALLLLAFSFIACDRDEYDVQFASEVLLPVQFSYTVSDFLSAMTYDVVQTLEYDGKKITRINETTTSNGQEIVRFETHLTYNESGELIREQQTHSGVDENGENVRVVRDTRYTRKGNTVTMEGYRIGTITLDDAGNRLRIDYHHPSGGKEEPYRYSYGYNYDRFGNMLGLKEGSLYRYDRGVGIYQQVETPAWYLIDSPVFSPLSVVCNPTGIYQDYYREFMWAFEYTYNAEGYPVTWKKSYVGSPEISIDGTTSLVRIEYLRMENPGK